MQNTFEPALTFDDVLLVPQYSSIKHRSDVNTSVVLHKNLKLEIPLISANMDTVTESAMAIAMAKAGGLGVIHRFLTIEQQVAEVKKVKKLNLKVGAAVGVKEGEKDRAKALIAAGTDLLVLDIAHGHTEMAGEMLRFLKKLTTTPVAAGNVATAEGVVFLAKNGADIIKVGIGAGSACTTRIMTGSGMPQLSAIINCSFAARKYGFPIIADGGMKIPADLVKALGAGASVAMSGNLLAGTDEAPGKIITKDGKRYKVYRGMASFSANQRRTDKKINKEGFVAEGAEGLVPYRGSVKDMITTLIGGLRSGMTYAGAKNLAEFRKRAKFIQITPAALIENGVHDLTIV
jgi:IMP dehydrogenase